MKTNSQSFQFPETICANFLHTHTWLAQIDRTIKLFWEKEFINKWSHHLHPAPHCSDHTHTHTQGTLKVFLLSSFRIHLVAHSSLSTHTHCVFYDHNEKKKKKRFHFWLFPPSTCLPASSFQGKFVVAPEQLWRYVFTGCLLLLLCIHFGCKHVRVCVCVWGNEFIIFVILIDFKCRRVWWWRWQSMIWSFFIFQIHIQNAIYYHHTVCLRSTINWINLIN